MQRKINAKTQRTGTPDHEEIKAELSAQLKDSKTKTELNVTQPSPFKGNKISVAASSEEEIKSIIAQWMGTTASVPHNSAAVAALIAAVVKYVRFVFSWISTTKYIKIEIENATHSVLVILDGRREQIFTASIHKSDVRNQDAAAANPDSTKSSRTAGKQKTSTRTTSASSNRGTKVTIKTGGDNASASDASNK